MAYNQTRVEMREGNPRRHKFKLDNWFKVRRSKQAPIILYVAAQKKS